MFTAYFCPYIRLVAETPPDDVPIRPASTVVLARDGADGVEVLMVRRSDEAVFMRGAYVFPGGAVDDVDDGPLARAAVSWSGDPEEFRWRAAALRELFEEARVPIGVEGGIDSGEAGAGLYAALVESGRQLDANRLEYVGNWVTPLGPPRRFDARFFVAVADGDPVTDDREVFDAAWVRPADAIGAADRGDWRVEVPTRSTLSYLSAYQTTEELMSASAARQVERIAPRIDTADDGSIRVLLPGDDGFEQATA